jgi:flagellar basal-body rod protein FlgB
MVTGLFDSSTLPVLEQVVTFTEARHGVLAGNIANLDTPGYRSQDLSTAEFQTRLKDAIESRQRAADTSRAPYRHGKRHAPSRRQQYELGRAGQRDCKEPGPAQFGAEPDERPVSIAAGGHHGTAVVGIEPRRHGEH